MGTQLREQQVAAAMKQLPQTPDSNLNPSPNPSHFKQQHVSPEVPIKTSNNKSTSTPSQSSPPPPPPLHAEAKLQMKKQLGNLSGGSGTSSTGKRRSTWRNLLTPSYKTRSDEFHKLFCDKIPKNEPLIADYACALHREILIQGRIYISVNYAAFYSNLFSWITKLVIRLRDVSEIYKANTARIIPNAIQLIMTSGEKHVFASFVARDKSYVMMLRIWQNNLMNERMTDQEIRNLVYFSYGKDLGMGDNEELKINSPDPVTPANIPINLEESSEPSSEVRSASDDQQRQVDRNNNPNSNSSQRRLTIETAVEVETSEMRRSLSSPVQQVFKESRDLADIGFGHTRYNSYDFNSRAQSIDQDKVIAEVVNRLNELTDSNVNTEQQEEEEEDGNQLMDGLSWQAGSATYSPAPSSAVIVETPLLLRQTFVNSYSGSSKGRQQLEGDYVSRNGEVESQTAGDGGESMGSNESKGCTGLTAKWIEPRLEEQEQEQEAGGQAEDEKPAEVTTDCGCKEHEGQLIADQEFDINIDTLFTLIFTNSKFMRTYMSRRGMTNSNISGWKLRSSNSGGDKSTTSSSTTLSDGRPEVADLTQLVRIKQVRKLNYSMSLDHMWAKQVQVEELQNICQVKPGVYVLKSTTTNSGIPYGETFTVDMIYCLTRNGHINKSRMLVHSFVNFDKEKQNWRLAMVKSVIERQSLQGVRDFIGDLTICIRDYIKQSEELEGRGETRELGAEQAGEKPASGKFPRHQHSRGASLTRLQPAGAHQVSSPRGHHYVRHGSLARAKSKLKERKLRSMYRYYIHDLEGGRLNQQAERRHSDSSDSGSSLGSFEEQLDESGSMMMVLHGTDDQLSSGPSAADKTSDELGWRTMEEASMDRSVSDVDSRRSCSRRLRPNRWRAAARRSPLAGEAPQPQRPPVGCPKPAGSWASGEVRLGRKGAGLLMVTLLIVLFAVVVSHVIILRRLDSLEQRIRVQCGQPAGGK